MGSYLFHKYRKGYVCLYGISILFLLFICGACTDNNLLSDKTDNRESSVTVTLTLPGDVNLQSMTVEDENKVENLQVLAFREDHNSGNYYYAYKAEGKNFTFLGNQLTFEVTLYQYQQKQQFLFLANAQQALNNSTITTGTEIEDAVTELIITNASEWQARNKGVKDWETGIDASSDEIRYIPMYGRTEEISVIPDIMDTYSLLRMLSRFDIINSAGNFKMVYACLFQWNDKGFLGYDKTNWDLTNHTVISANIPDGTTKTKQPTFYYSADSEGKSIESSMYAFEAKGTTEHLEATALVVGGYYEGDESTLCWYRADIPKFDSEEKIIEGAYGDILRNHLYQFEITEVNGPGYPTPPEAYEGGIRIKADVDNWNLATQTIILDGQYRFETSHATINFDREGGTVTVELTTTHPDGLVLEKVTDGTGWLTVSPLNGTGGKAIFQATATENITGYNRTASILIKAGNLNYTIKVIQNERRWVEGDQHQIYYKNDKEYEIIVQSISPWELQVIDDHHVLDWYEVESEGNDHSRIKFYMTDKAYNDLYDAAYFIFHDKNGIYPPAIYPIVSMENDEASPYGPFNCLIVPVNQSIEVHSAFRKARGVWLHGDGVSGPLSDAALNPTGLSMDIVWQDATRVVTDLDLKNIGENSYFTVKGNTPGNAVIALKQGTDIIWSWHIWVVPTNEVPQDISGWMDRNLGALQAGINSTNSTSMGLLYQWGRKDPFVVSSQYNNRNQQTVVGARTVYDGSGNLITDTQTKESGSPYQLVAGVTNNLKNSIMNPFIFYGGITQNIGSSSPADYYSVTDWYCDKAYYVQHKGRFEGQCHNLWNGKAQGKMPFDPCPKGYRIPRMQDWGVDDSLDQNVITAQAGINQGTVINNYGVTNENYGGNYHMGGFRYSHGEHFANPGVLAYYWSSTDGHHNINVNNFHSRIIRHTRLNDPDKRFDVIQSFGRSHGMSVKCVADNKD